MSYLDILLAVPLVFGLIRGFMKGLIVELTAIMALILGVYGAILLSNAAGSLLNKQFGWSAEISAVVAFVMIFAALVILVHLLARVIERGIKLAALGLPNKLAGAAIGFLKMGLFVSVLLLIIDKINRHMDFLPREQKQRSILWQPVADITREHFPKVAESSAFHRLKEQAGDLNEQLKKAVN